ncbi:MAG: hypothetical protein RL324_1290 [Verrucomicrobiota bacterium]
MAWFLYLIPILILLEIWQLFLSERYLGVKQIGADADPRTLGLSEITAFAWSMSIILSWVWSVLVLFQPLGRLQAFAMILISILGYTLRRGCRLKWVLVILTFEGALRVGMLISLIGMAFFQRRY